MNDLLTKLGLASGSSIVLTEAINLDRLWSALITLCISVLSVLAVDGINLLKSYLRKKKDDVEKDSTGGN